MNTMLSRMSAMMTAALLISAGCADTEEEAPFEDDETESVSGLTGDVLTIKGTKAKALFDAMKSAKLPSTTVDGVTTKTAALIACSGYEEDLLIMNCNVRATKGEPVITYRFEGRTLNNPLFPSSMLGPALRNIKRLTNTETIDVWGAKVGNVSCKLNRNVSPAEAKCVLTDKGKPFVAIDL